MLEHRFVFKTGAFDVPVSGVVKQDRLIPSRLFVEICVDGTVVFDQVTHNQDQAIELCHQRWRFWADLMRRVVAKSGVHHA